MSVKVKFKIGEKKGITANYTVEKDNPIKTVFKINAASASFYSLTGSPYDNANLKDALDAKADKSELDADMAAVDESISNVQTVVENNYNTLDTKIDNVNSDLSGDISTLENTVNSNNTAVNNRIDATNQTVADNNTAINNRVDGIVDSFDGDISNLETAIQNEAATRANNDTLLQGDINTLRNDLTSEISNRVSADNTLQDNIDNLSDTVLNNYNTLDAKIDSVSNGLSEDITNLTQTVKDNYTELNDYILNLSDTVDANDTAINNKVDELNTTLSDNINTLSGIVSNNYTTLDTKIDNTKSAIDSDISDLSDTVNQNYTDLNNAITASASTINSRIDTEVSTLNTAITTENTQRQAADSNLQSQIDAITSASDVFDIVGTYAELQAYDISTVPVNDIIKVLVDSTHNNAATYYRCVENDGVKSWTYVGSEGAYYTKSESDNTFVAKTTTINNKPLSNNITLTANDVNALPADTVIGSGIITLQKNGVDVDSFNVNATANKSINISVPTDTGDLTNNAGYIKVINSTDVINALGYTPYNASNPAGFITSADLPTNLVTTDTVQDISGRKTFLGEKAIYFKQVTTSNKLGFTLYNPSNTELAALEYRPNTISGASLLALNCPQTTGGYVGFRYWGSPAVNIIAPKVATAGNYFIPTHITDGNTTVTANNQGTVDISSLLPDVSGFATQTWVQSQNYITSSALTDYVTNTSLATTLQGYVLSSDLSTTLTNYVTSSSLTTVLTGYQPLLESGTNIKTINNINLLGSGNIDTREIYTAVFDESTFTDVQNAYNSGKIIKCNFLGKIGSVTCYLVFYNDDYFVFMGESRYREVDNIQYIFLRLDSNDNWIYWRKENADTTLSNVSSINSNSAVATALDGKVSKSGDTMTGNLTLYNAQYITRNDAIDTTTIPSSTVGYDPIVFQDANGISTGGLSVKRYSNGGHATVLYSKADGADTWTNFEIGFNNNNTAYCNFPNTKCVDGQWVGKSYTLLSNGNLSVAKHTYSLSSYLPDDGYNYEVLFDMRGRTGTSPGNSALFFARTSIVDNLVICYNSTRTSNYQVFGGNGILPVGTDRKLIIELTNQATTNTTIMCRGYRRIGTNN